MTGVQFPGICLFCALLRKIVDRMRKIIHTDKKEWKENNDYVWRRGK